MKMIILIHFIFSTMAPSCQSESPMSMSVPFAQPTVGDNLCKSPRHWVWPKNVKKLARHSMFVCTSFVFLCNIYVGLSRPRVLASDDSDVPGFLTQPANSWALPRLYMWKSPMALLKSPVVLACAMPRRGREKPGNHERPLLIACVADVAVPTSV